MRRNLAPCLIVLTVALLATLAGCAAGQQQAPSPAVADTTGRQGQSPGGQQAAATDQSGAEAGAPVAYQPTVPLIFGTPDLVGNGEVAILTLTISGPVTGTLGEGSVLLSGGRIEKTYPPNVLGQPGPWQVEVVGASRTVRFGTFDPRQSEVLDTAGDQAMTYTYTTPVTWDLVVPLTDEGGNDLEAQRINIYDENFELIFSTEVLYEQWLTPVPAATPTPA